jgi:phospholipase/lecithinase/hemolysin
MNFLDWSRKHNYAISENWHPLEQAHQLAADYLLPTVNHLLHTKYPRGEINETI